MAHLIGLKDFEAKSSKDYKVAMLHVQKHMEEVLDDDLLLALVMGGGRETYRNVFQREFRSMEGVDSEMAEMLWSLFLQTWRGRFPHVSPKQYLDAVEQNTPLTEREIDEMWVVESASSDDGRRYFGEH